MDTATIERVAEMARISHNIEEGLQKAKGGSLAEKYLLNHLKKLEIAIKYMREAEIDNEKYQLFILYDKYDNILINEENENKKRKISALRMRKGK
jgi:hypothetical protein